MGMMIVAAFIMISAAMALWPWEDTLGMAQHHNAMMGTAKQYMAEDYSF